MDQKVINAYTGKKLLKENKIKSELALNTINKLTNLNKLLDKFEKLQNVNKCS